jgi:hypothetical protein
MIKPELGNAEKLIKIYGKGHIYYFNGDCYTIVNRKGKYHFRHLKWPNGSYSVVVTGR